MAKKNAGLGRGLSAILGEVEEAYQNNLNDNSGLVVEIEIDKIKPNPLQPRKVFDNESLQELAASIQEHGLLQPILVYEDMDNSDEYFLIAGERRLRASKIAHKESIKAIIVDVQEEKLRELALIENIQREDLNPIDLAQSYKELIEDYGITHEELAKKLSKSRTQITNTLRLLELDKNVQKYVLENKISQGHAKVLVALPKEQQNIIANSIIGQKLSVHDTENLIRKLKEGQLQDKKIPSLAQNRISPHSKEQLEKICKAIQKQNLNIKLQKNKIIVEFSNDEEVERFSKILPNISF
ncbi:ParB/RepB/Spo0J family partition protein [Helicobacter pullorum]|uniref:Chromosome partitioning protein n=2 Tax=Helicobacter pullorum TaxID=35818 RepID=A0A1C0W2I9_9HELI|nr:ParB/RepB/Spo0J family partition protein [Helicobacter pullorum]EEQ62940.1 putative stage 0 sporulation protein J [Helicobacter pullorum MIT 98-5489]OCR10318.1 chromosome partitioning protein ParB [Helicobacter pullorum]OCR17109.1 chromosome partitioning protein ParB [Helicobacter pullorum]OCR20327.1 chromosome partitioning protein ParB [Helicobacter pullorum]STQ87749.1 chromosome partitioning protein [Helicobacter pullorum]